ncbi:MAG: molybdopterin-binding protein [Dehalococcoidales bacterium]|nr:molybdopterin-binding protein [Dehalococcoidales bacterium]
MDDTPAQPKGLFTVVPPGEAWRRLAQHIRPTGREETLVLANALGRVTARAVPSPGDLPSFPRSTMDGFAVRAEDTYGASEGLPAFLRLVGEVPMGRAPSLSVGAGEAALIHTGGMLPPGANAVVMVEVTQQMGDSLEVYRAVAVGENVVQVGEDVHTGEVILPAGHVLRPQDLGALAAMGVMSVPVTARPLVAILATGDEVVPPQQTPGPGQVRDVNSAVLRGLVQQSGGEPLPLGIAPDNFETLLAMARQGLVAADALVVAAGSSVSTRDMTARAIDELGPPGVIVHGVALRPGKPTILAVADGKPVFGLPGNPVSAMTVAELLLVPAVYALAGCRERRRPALTARLTANIPSAPGREDFVPVRLSEGDGGLEAEPVFGKSNLIFTTVRADGVVKVPLDLGGLLAGDTVTVTLY